MHNDGLGRTTIRPEDIKIDHENPTPVNLDKMKSLRTISDARKTYTPGWTVKEPDGHVVDKCDSPVAAELKMDSRLLG